jgi:hypothetical protein
MEGFFLGDIAKIELFLFGNGELRFHLEIEFHEVFDSIFEFQILGVKLLTIDGDVPLLVLDFVVFEREVSSEAAVVVLEIFLFRVVLIVHCLDLSTKIITTYLIGFNKSTKMEADGLPNKR